MYWKGEHIETGVSEEGGMGEGEEGEDGERVCLRNGGR